MPLKITSELDELRACFQNHYGGGSLPIYSGYRDPEHNEHEGGEKYSKHQYALAVDLSPIPDMNGNGSNADEAQWLRDHATGTCSMHTQAGFAKVEYGGNTVHVDWR